MYISINSFPAYRAIMLAFFKGFLIGNATATAYLRSVAGIHRYGLAAGPFSLIDQHRNEFPHPASSMLLFQPLLAVCPLGANPPSSS